MVRNVVVSGGGTGMGRAIAAAFAAAGDTVVILGRRQEVLEDACRELGSSVTAIVCDVSDPASVTAVLDRLPGHVDVLVNAAGANMATRTPTPNGLQDVAGVWEGQIRANLITSVVLTYALLDRMGPGGRIIGFSSSAARSGGPNSNGYGVAKAAVEAWCRSLSAEVGAGGITVNVIAPGLTDGTDFFPIDLGDEVRDRLLARADNRRVGTTAEIAAAVQFLASEGAGHITGHTLPVDGGIAFHR